MLVHWDERCPDGDHAQHVGLLRSVARVLVPENFGAWVFGQLGPHGVIWIDTYFATED